MKNFPVVKNNDALGLKKTKVFFRISNTILNDETNFVLSNNISSNQEVSIGFDDNIEAWLDTETSLMWEVKTKKNIDYKYVWSLKNVNNAWKKEELLDSVKDIDSYVENINLHKLGGYSDWRVPSIDELETLLCDTIPYIKKSLSHTNGSAYWSSTTAEKHRSTALIVFFNNGTVSRDGKYIGYCIRCVRKHEPSIKI